ncbi:Hypothetical predicted protein [Olea europaea subsp. europaea]|uniref:Uncharacterized protein n=1 Tax=Olea europaea subsp. europaea TaxID=158383 RepID=A0A8S0PBC0_OLEEU|nr:Hypothetical predicted protein [Olea europaea subsp. europaea]
MATQNFEPIHFTYVKDKIDGKSPLLGALFLFCIFLITFLFVYFLYVCTHRRRGSTATHPDGSLARSRSPAGLDAATISSLPIFSYGSSANGKNSNPDSDNHRPTVDEIGSFDAIARRPTVENHRQNFRRQRSSTISLGSVFSFHFVAPV